ncbi:HNH endonuclease signature motif containing protein [Microbacterium sp. MPKO10]|uniref:HNH endonuclease signature motif containing protein n=1 Tax=Microbacterium sp. MPKO10 TaxID=2989818 RepID=UPI002235974E|nr:HNH endonuclease signature motif containing protein [Microbacterium sp. MPKO10]MCW4459200.1 HNH endonuclease [Microbacterium sp. MPKO10]
MEKPVERSIEAVAGIASAAASGVLDVLPRSAAAASDGVLLEAVAALGELGRAQQAALAVVAAEVATRSVKVEGAQTLATRNGQRTAAGLLQSTARISQSAARRALAYGEAITIDSSMSGAPLPPRWGHIADAAFDGTVDVEAVVPVVRHLDEVRLSADPELLDVAEDGMMRIAAGSTPEYSRQQMRVWKEALDPDGARPREEAQRRARFFRIGRTDQQGMTPVKGLLTPDAAAHLHAAISTHTNPRARVTFAPTENSTNTAGDGAPENGDTSADAAGVGTRDLDPRTHGQKLHDILDGLISSGHRASVTDGGSRRAMTQVIVTATVEDLTNGNAVGWINGADEPAGPVTTERIICDAGYRPLLHGEHGEALWMGATQRAFTPQQKLAIAVRDETCAWPECDMPADWCDVHHAVPWSQGGPTDIDNGMLLCSAHHHMLHAQNWHIFMQSGIPYLTPPPFISRSHQPIRLGQNRPRQVTRARDTRRKRRGTRAGERGTDPPDSS